MLNDATGFKHAYVATGKTDLRKGQSFDYTGTMTFEELGLIVPTPSPVPVPTNVPENK